MFLLPSLKSHSTLKLILAVAFTTGWLHAAPYFGEETFTYRQPDGETFQVRLFGDEFFAYQETTDGYLVIRDPNDGLLCYAKVTPDGSDIVSTGVRVGQAKPAGLKPKQRLRGGKAMEKSLGNRNLLGVDSKGRRNPGKKLLPGKAGEILNVPAAEAGPQPAPVDGSTTGSDPIVLPAPPTAPTLNQRVGLVLLASFPDRPADITKTVADIDDYCNAEVYTTGGNATSVYGYFKIQSNGKLTYKNNVTAWFTAANPRSYYTDNTITYTTRAKDLIKEGLAVLKAQGFDFTQCDGDNNGKLDGVNIFYAGGSVNAWSEGLWPHQSSSSWTGLTGTGLSSTAYDYQITDMPTSLSIGTFCHENGHMICDFPDLYSYGATVGEGSAANMGTFSLMASSGSTHPRHVDPYLKIHAGWADVVDITSTSHLLCAVQQDRNFFYRYKNPARATEYFLFEVRGTAGYEGVWGGAGATNPANGLVVYHALQGGSNTRSTIITADAVTNYTTPYELMVVEATPTTAVIPWYDDPTPTSNDAFTASGVSSISDSTTPNLKFWAADGRTVASGANINTISAPGATMTFIAGSGPLPATPATNVTATQLQPKVDFGENAANQTFSVFNGGGDTLTYNISDDVAWLACAPVSGTATTEADLITVTYTTNALAAGTHTATITIDGGAAGIKTIGVTLTVNQQPTLAATPGSFSLAGLAGTTGPSATFNVSNSGGGTAAYTMTKTQAWLSLDRASGTVATEHDLITLTCDATSLAAGTYNDTITVTAPGATNSPLSIPVSFTVDGSEMILITPNGGENWYPSTTKNITWSSSLGGNVKIELLKAGLLDSTISAGTPNDGSYSWLIPSGQTLGTDYTIKVTSLNPGAQSDTSFTNFSIAAPPTAVSIPYVESFESGIGTWVQSTSDGMDWTRDSAGTPTGSTGPTTGQDGSFYLFTEASANTNKLAQLTCWFNLISHSNAELKFYYHMYGSSMGSLTLEASTDGVSWDTLFSQSGDQGNVWNLAAIDLSAYAGQYVQFRFNGTVGTNIYSDMAIDNITVADIGYAVTYNGNGSDGGSQPTDINVYSPGATATVLGNTGTLIRTGYAFNGWNTAANGSGTSYTAGNTFTIAADVTLYAMWTSVPTYTVSYNANGATSGSVPSNQTKTQGVNLILATNYGSLAKSGYLFAGWNTAANGTGTSYATGATYGTDAALNLYATWTAIGILAVTPAGDLNASGGYSGPFSPPSNVYTLTNSGTASLNWTATKTAAWVTLSSPGGTLAAGANTTVTVSINSGADSLNVNNYSDTVSFANTTNGNGNDTRAVSLTVNKASQTIAFAALSPVLDNAAPFALTGSASSGLTVSYASSNTSVATVSGSTVTIVGVGATTITASQAGDTNYNAAASVPQTLTVGRANPLANTGGPYSILFGQALSLNGSGSFPSYTQTITDYDWDLNNDNTFGDVTGATPAAISYADLTTTWGRVPGANTIQLKITDSSGKTSIISTTLTLVTSLVWDANNSVAGQADGGGTWTNANQWWDGSGNVTWVDYNNAIFGNGGAGGTVTVGTVSAGTVLLNNFTGTYTLQGTSTTLAQSGGITIGVGAGNVTIKGTGASPNTLTIDGAGGITMNGSGLVNLSGNLVMNYTGSTVINSGVVMLGDAANRSTGNFTLNGGMLTDYYRQTHIFSSGLGTGANQIQIHGESGFGGGNGNSIFQIGTSNSVLTWGDANFDPTKLKFRASLGDNNGPSIYGQATLNNKLDLNGGARTIDVFRSGANVLSSSATIAGGIQDTGGTGSLIKTGGGTLVLGAASTWGGNTTVSGGLLDWGATNLANIGGGSGRKISVAAGAIVKFGVISNAILQRIVETSDEFTVMTGTTSNALDFSSSTGANLSGTFLSNYAGNGAKCEISGVITPGGGAYRLGAPEQNGALGIRQESLLSGANGLIIGGNRVVIVGTHTFTGDTTLRDGAVLGLSGRDADAGAAKNNSLGLQNSVLDLGAPTSTGLIFLEAGNAGGITGLTTVANGGTQSATFGGLKGSRNLYSAFKFTGPGNNTSAQVAANITGFTLNPGSGVACNYSGAIADFATGTTITKTGLGTQILAGANTYTGATTVSEGKLFINGDSTSATGAVSVAANATLGGTGIIGGNTTIAATGKLEFDLSTADASHNSLEVATGKALTFSGASTLTITSSSGGAIGTYTLITGGNNITGVAPATVNLPAGWVGTVSISGNSLVLNLTSISGDTTPPTLASSAIVDNKSGGPIVVNTQVTYAVTFSEDMDASTVIAADFGNAGSSTISIGTISETFETSGVFTVLVTPTSVGTLQLKVNSGAVLKDAAGNDLVTTSAIADDTTITVQSPYQNWSGGEVFTADANNDGVSNGMEWLLGAANVNANSISLLPTFDNTTDTNYFIYTYRRSDAANTDLGTTIAVEYGDTLGTWTSAVHDGTNIIITPTNDAYGAGVDKVEVKIKKTLAPGGKLFSRLKVVINQ